MPPVNLDLDTLRTLVVAFDLGGYGRAAERLGRTPSAISLQMKRLQQEVDAPLFRKDGRKLGLTEAGEIVLRYGRRMLELNDEMLDTVRGASLTGRVRLGFAQDFSETILPQVLARYTTHYPLVQIEVRIDRNTALVDAIEKGRLDLALALGHSDRPIAQKLGELPVVWIAGSEFVPRTEQSLPLVMIESPCVFRQLALNALDQAGISWRIALVSPGLAGLWAAARAKLGVTARAQWGLSPGLMAHATLFDLPKLGSIPVTLHRTADRQPAAVDRLADIVSETVTQTIPGRADS